MLDPGKNTCQWVPRKGGQILVPLFATGPSLATVGGKRVVRMTREQSMVSVGAGLPAALPFTLSAVCAWDAGGAGGAVMSSRDVGAYNQWSLNSSTGRMEVRLAGQLGASANPTVDYRDAVLRHHMWCFDGTTHRFFVNGVAVGVQQASGNPQPSFADLRLRVGGSSSAGSDYSAPMAGHIMSLAVFDVDLSADPGQFDAFSGYIAGRMA